VKANDGTQNFVKAAGRDDLRLRLNGPNGTPVVFSFARGIKVYYSSYALPGGAMGYRRAILRGFLPNGDENSAYNDTCAWDATNPGDPRGLVSHVTSEGALANVSHTAGAMSYTLTGATAEAVTISQNAYSGATHANGLSVVTAVEGGVTYVSYRDVVAHNGRAYTFGTDGTAAAMWPDTASGSGTYTGNYGTPYVTWLPGFPETVFEVTPDEKSVVVVAFAGSVSESRNGIQLGTTTFDALGRYTGSSEQGGAVEQVLSYDGLWRTRAVASSMGTLESLETTAFDPQSGLPSLTTRQTSLEPLQATRIAYSSGSNGVMLSEETLLGGALVNGVVVGGKLTERIVPAFTSNPATSFPVLAGWTNTAFDTLLGQVTTSFTVSVTPTQRRITSVNNPAFVETETFDELGRPMTDQTNTPIGSAIASVLERGPGGYPSNVEQQSTLFGGPTLSSGYTLGILPNGYEMTSSDPLCSSSDRVTTSNGMDVAQVASTSCLGITSSVTSGSPNPQTSASVGNTVGPGIATTMNQACALSSIGVLRCDEAGIDEQGDPELNSYSESGH
jgi:hypothetical protein